MGRCRKRTPERDGPSGKGWGEGQAFPWEIGLEVLGGLEGLLLGPMHERKDFRYQSKNLFKIFHLRETREPETADKRG